MIRRPHVLAALLCLAVSAAADEMTPPKTPLTKEQEREAFHPRSRGHAAGAAPRRLRAAPPDGEGLDAGGPPLPARGAGGAGRPHRGHRGAARAPGRVRGGLRLRRAVAHRQPGRELDAAVRPRVVDHDRRRGPGRSGRADDLRRHRREQLQPHLLRRHRPVQDHGRRPHLAPPRPRRLAPHRARRRGRAAIRAPSTSPPSGTCTRTTPSAACTSPRTAARRGRASSTWTTGRAPSTSCRTRAARRCSTRRCGSARAPPATSWRAGPAAGSGSRRTRGQTGRAWAEGCPPARPSDASASPCPPRAPRRSTPSSTTRPCAPDSEPLDEETPPGELTPRRLRALTADAFARLDDAVVTRFLQRYDFPKPLKAAALKSDVKAGKITVAELIAYLSDANRDLFERQIVGPEVYRSDDGGADLGAHARGPPGQGLLLVRLLLRPHQRRSRRSRADLLRRRAPARLHRRRQDLDGPRPARRARRPPRRVRGPARAGAAGPRQRRRPQPLLRPRRGPGRRSTTCPSASSRPSPWTTRSRTTSWAGCRTTA